MTILIEISQAMQKALSQTADEAGRSSGFIQRQVNVTAAKFCQTLVFGLLSDAEASLEAWCQTGVAVGLEISPQGLERAFYPCSGGITAHGFRGGCRRGG
jgi:hypothetical protein